MTDDAVDLEIEKSKGERLREGGPCARSGAEEARGSLRSFRAPARSEARRTGGRGGGAREGAERRAARRGPAAAGDDHAGDSGRRHTNRGDAILLDHDHAPSAVGPRPAGRERAVPVQDPATIAWQSSTPEAPRGLLG